MWLCRPRWLPELGAEGEGRPGPGRGIQSTNAISGVTLRTQKPVVEDTEDKDPEARGFIHEPSMDTEEEYSGFPWMGPRAALSRRRCRVCQAHHRREGAVSETSAIGNQKAHTCTHTHKLICTYSTHILHTPHMHNPIHSTH